MPVVPVHKLLAQETQGDITLSVTATGGDSPRPDRPLRLVKGDYSARPFGTVQAALNALPKRIVAEHSVIINVGPGDFDPFVVEGFQFPTLAAEAFKISGTRENYTPTQGPESGTADDGDYNSLTVTDADWVPDEMVGKFARITAGTGSGKIFVISGNTEEKLIFGGWVGYNLDDTSEFQLEQVTTNIWGWTANGVVLQDNAPGNTLDNNVIARRGRILIQDIHVCSEVTGTSSFLAQGSGSCSFVRCVAEGMATNHLCRHGFAAYSIDVTELHQCCTIVSEGCYGFQSSAHFTRSLGYLDCFAAVQSQLGIALFDKASVQSTSFFLRDCTTGVKLGTPFGSQELGCRSALLMKNGGHFIDGSDVAIQSDGGDLRLRALNIINSTNTFQLMNTFLNIFTGVTGDDTNSGFGLNLHGIGNIARIEVMPTIIGSNGAVTVDGLNDVTWAALNTQGDYAVDLATGARIYNDMGD